MEIIDVFYNFIEIFSIDTCVVDSKKFMRLLMYEVRIHLIKMRGHVLI